MSNLIPQPGAGASHLPATGINQFSKAELRDLTRAQNAEVTKSTLAATRLQSAGMLTAASIQFSAMLSREATFMADGDPNAAARLNHLADCYTQYAASEIMRLRNE